MTTNRKVALVTGASSGIGHATAQALLKTGYRVFGTSRQAVPSEAGDIAMIRCDVTDQGLVDGMVDHVLAEAGRIDLLVNNAGHGLFGAAEETSIEEAKAAFETNFFGVLRVTNAVLPNMRRQGSGRIVNVSSLLGLIPAPFLAVYAASKFALEGYSETLDHEVRSQGIRVVLVEPAYTRTSFESSMVRAGNALPTYDAARSQADRIIRDSTKTGDDPAIVAETIVAAAEAAQPRLRYTAGKFARRVSLLRRFVPASAFDKSVRKQSGL